MVVPSDTSCLKWPLGFFGQTFPSWLHPAAGGDTALDAEWDPVLSWWSCIRGTPLYRRSVQCGCTSAVLITNIVAISLVRETVPQSQAATVYSNGNYSILYSKQKC